MEVMQIKWTGLQEVLSDIDQRLAAAKQTITDDMTWFGKGASDEMVQTHTFQNRTYRLERSIGYDVVPMTYVTVFVLTWYASQVEFGVPGRSRPYPFFWPVWYTWVANLNDRLQQDWPMAFEQGR